MSLAGLGSSETKLTRRRRIKKLAAGGGHGVTEEKIEIWPLKFQLIFLVTQGEAGGVDALVLAWVRVVASELQPATYHDYVSGKTKQMHAECVIGIALAVVVRYDARNTGCMEKLCRPVLR